MFKLTVDREIELRGFHPDDAEVYFDLVERNRARLRPWIHPKTLPKTARDARLFTLECYFDTLNNSKESLVIYDHYREEIGDYFLCPRGCLELGIWFQDNLAGQITFSHLTDSSTAVEFGYWLSAEQEGKGIITRSVSALMDFAIDEMKILRFVIGCAVSNLPSRAVPLRLGYRLHETQPNGEVVGDFIYDRTIFGIRSSTWLERK
jgi:ribosomal-protein-serine acetyltransferase